VLLRRQNPKPRLDRTDRAIVTALARLLPIPMPLDYPHLRRASEDYRASAGTAALGQLSREATYADYPQVLRDSTRDIIDEIKRRNGWQDGDTVCVVLHAARPPRNADFALLMRDVHAAGGGQHIEFAFVTVSHGHRGRITGAEKAEDAVHRTARLRVAVAIRRGDGLARGRGRPPVTPGRGPWHGRRIRPNARRPS
jgi:hypothetical protein